MTGRFQRMWGDFGGLKPQPALEYECFRSQALGGANSIGDQLPPRGQPDAGAYDLIGAVFAQCAAAEPFYKNSTALPQVGIIAPGDPSIDAAKADQSLEGAVQMCEENHYDSIVLDDKSDLDGLDLVILPDSVVVTPPLQKRLAAFHKRGGKLIASHRSGFIANSAAPADPADTASLIPGLDLKTHRRRPKIPDLLACPFRILARTLTQRPRCLRTRRQRHRRTGDNDTSRTSAPLLPPHRPHLLVAFSNAAASYCRPSRRRPCREKLRVFCRPHFPRIPPLWKHRRA